MLSERMYQALNEQINAEMWSAYLYLSMSADFSSKGMPGFANWMSVQFKEEQDHAIKLFNYIIARGEKPELLPIAEVKSNWITPLEIFQETLSHEQKVTALINNLYTIATEENDYATQSMLKFFIDEQIEEEEAAQALIDALRMINGDGLGIYTLDKELATRVYVPLIVK